jgi:hypothetical protein
MTQTTVYVARGMLIESKKPTWLYGTASEHAVLYQYQFYNAKYVHAGMIQTESPYYQPNPLPPYPFADSVGKFKGDPTHSCSSTTNSTPGCDASWAVRLTGSSDISIAGAGLYSWFQTYGQTCIDHRNCQKSLVNLERNGPGVYFHNLITIGAESMLTTGFGEVSAKNNAAPDSHPFWSHITVYNVSPERQTADDDDDDDEDEEDIDVIYYPQDLWSKPVPEIGCNAPCSIILPPFKIGSTTTITWPPYTTSVYVSSGDSMYIKTTTIDVPPFTTDRIDFWPIYVTEDDQPLATVTPVQSVKPPPLLLTLPGSEATIPPSPYPTGDGMGSPTTTKADDRNDTLLPVFFITGSRTVTLKPMPTVSISLPPPDIPLVTYRTTSSPTTTPKTSSTTSPTRTSSQSPTPTCVIDCGKRDCDYGCPHTKKCKNKKKCKPKPRGKGDCGLWGELVWEVKSVYAISCVFSLLYLSSGYL